MSIREGFYLPTGRVHSEPDVLVLTGCASASDQWIICEMRFARDDVELVDSDGPDFAKAREYAAKQFGIAKMMRIQSDSAKQQIWKCWLKEDTDGTSEAKG